MNAFAFSQAASKLYAMAAAIALGLAVPALIYALARVAAAMFIDAHSRA